ncbi:Protein of unknown function [Gryllus bimaculatus]|nr:Protein of unknown function [Gryllus bimaculatus]
MLKGHTGEAETLDEKIKRIRKKNEEIEKRRLEVEADKQTAAKSNALVQLNAPMEDWPLPRSHSPEEERERKFSGIHQDKPRERNRGNVTFCDTDESNRPPPDPAYRFLADSERDPIPPKHMERSQRHLHNRGNNTTRGRSRDSKGGGGGGGAGYEAWRAERSRIDQERIRRQRTDQGLWRREWDEHKSEDNWKEPRNETSRDSHSTSNRASRSNVPPESTKDVIIKRRTFSEESKGEISVRIQKNIGSWGLNEKQGGAPAENRNIQNRGNSLHVSFVNEPSLPRGRPRGPRAGGREAPGGGGKSSGDGDDSWEDADDHSDEPATELALAHAHARARARGNSNSALGGIGDAPAAASSEGTSASRDSPSSAVHVEPGSEADGRPVSPSALQIEPDSAEGGNPLPCSAVHIEPDSAADGSPLSCSAVHVEPDSSADGRSPFENVNASLLPVPVPSSAVEKIEESVVCTDVESKCRLDTFTKEDLKDYVKEEAIACTNLTDVLTNESDTDFICIKTSNEEMNINTENTSTIGGSSTLCDTKTDFPVIKNETESGNIPSASGIQDRESVHILQNTQLDSVNVENTSTIADSSTLGDTKADISVMKCETENVNISSATSIQDRESVHILQNTQVDSVNVENTSTITGSSTLCDTKTHISIMNNETENINISSARDIQDKDCVNILQNQQIDSNNTENISTVGGSSTLCDTKTDTPVVKNVTGNVNISSSSGLQDGEIVNILQNPQVDSVDTENFSTIGGSSTLCDTKTDIVITKNETENGKMSSASSIQVRKGENCVQNPQLNSEDSAAVHPTLEDH